MNTVLFKGWLLENGASKKVAGDTVSRLKKINNALINSPDPSSIDAEYAFDQCERISNLLKYSNYKNAEVKNILRGLPFSKAYISTYKLALKKYIKFKKDTHKN